MSTHHRGFRLSASIMVALFLLPVVFVSGQLGGSSESTGRIVTFPIERFNDTLYASIDTTYRVAFDVDGDLWYTTQSGVVHVDIAKHRRDLFTRLDGLPSSYTLGLAVKGRIAYVGTELGLAVIDKTQSPPNITAYTTLNSALPDAIVQELAIVGDDMWVGTYFGGVGILNTTTDTWTLKNTSTTAGYAKPVRRIVAYPDTVEVATDGDGLWTYDRASGNWTVLLKEDGLVTNNVKSVLRGGQNIYIGTNKGLQIHRPYAPYAGTADEWVHFNKFNSKLPDDVILDLDFIPVQDGGVDLFAATRDGIWQYDGDTGNSEVRRQSFGLLGTYVLDDAFTQYGWAIATQRGVSLQRGGNWTYYTTGPSSTTVSSNGPDSFLFTSASTGDNDPLIWFGTPNGITGYRPPQSNDLGVWFNRGEWSRYPGGPVNWIDTEGGITWVGSNDGVYGYRHSSQEWFAQKVTNSRNLVYSLDADRGDLWIALFGDGLIMRNLTTGVSRSWDYTTTPPIPDTTITDVRAQANDVWIGASVGLIRLDRTTGQFTGTYTVSDGLPGTGIVFRVLPEGNVVWLGMRDGGVARLDVTTGRVTRTWDTTNTPGFPVGEVRSIHREGSSLWVGTTDGLARIDVTNGDAKTFRTSDSALIQNYVNGITSRDGIVYLATLSGVGRFDTVTSKFLPMHEGPDVASVRPLAPPTPVATPVRVTIISPRDLELVTGLHIVSGSAQHSGKGVDRVEVQIGEGAWVPANGTTSWTYNWDTSKSTPDETITVRARAFAGTNVSRPAELLAIPVRAPETPLSIEARIPPSATAGRPLILAAVAAGDEPLSARAYYRPEGEFAFKRIDLVKDGSLYKGTVPGRDVREGKLAFYFEASSGLDVRRDPVDTAEPFVVNVTPAPRLAVDVTGPASVEAKAGKNTPVALVVTNTGTEAATFILAASGKRPDWIVLSTDTIALQPGESQNVTASVRVPAEAFADAWNVTFAARDTTGVADPATVKVPLRITAGAPPTTTSTPTPTPTEKPRTGIPGPGVALVLVGLAAAVILRRRSL